MDALPQPGDVVTEDTFGQYQAAQRSYREDAISDARRDACTWRRLGVGGLLVGVAAVVAAAGVINRHTEHWGFIAYNESNGHVGVVRDIRDVALTLPTPVDDFFAKEFVRMRESWERTTAASYLAGASCMVRGDADRSQLDQWFNHDPAAPNQIAAKTQGSFRREATVLSEPVVDGALPNGTRHVGVRFAYRDVTGAVPGPSRLGVAYFNVRKDKLAITSCDPDGLIMSGYVRQLEPQRAAP